MSVVCCKEVVLLLTAIVVHIVSRPASCYHSALAELASCVMAGTVSGILGESTLHGKGLITLSTDP